MKHLIYLCALFIAQSALSQDSTSLKTETPKIVTKLLMGDHLKVVDIEIRFMEVLVDSRCPKNVNCVRAGEAKVAVEIYKDNKFLEKKVVEIAPTTYLYEKLPSIFSSENIQIHTFNLLPYPEFKVPIKKEDYYLQLVIEN